MRRLLILGGLIAALGGCAGRDFTKPISVTQDCMGTCSSTISIGNPPVSLTLPIGIPGGL